MIDIKQSGNSEFTTLLADWDKVPEYLYNGTYYNNLDKIEKYGLGNLNEDTRNYPNDLYNGNGIFLTITPESAFEYSQGLRNLDSKDVVVLRIPKAILNPENLYYDFNDYDTIEYVDAGCKGNCERTYFYKGIIRNPQNVLEIIDFN